MGASLLVPCLLFAFASWISYGRFEELTSERLVRSIDIEQEEARTTFLFIITRSTTEANSSPGCPRRTFAAMKHASHDRLKKLVTEIPLAQSIWIYDANGDVLVSTTAQPPPSHNFADRDFIRAPRTNDGERIMGASTNRCLARSPFSRLAGAWLATALSKGLSRFRFPRATSSGFSPPWLTGRACNMR